ncbi:DNA alkylation repair protein [Niallia sp. Krafla_26]|uniref:DNA alkylation repair protein n=1 Tax=Niallia sp. Krafla_26 TaxID=3064703 RepID=UPI003D186F33
MDEHLTQLKFHFERHRDFAKAEPMAKYMKNNYPFLGIKKPERTQLLRLFYAQTGILKEPFDPKWVRVLWAQEEREYHYAALDYLEKSQKKLDGTHISLMEELITTNSWWDTVDTIATKLVGGIARKSPEVILDRIEGWAYGEHLWLRRTAILFQLKYKGQTDESLLYRYIEQNADSKEFFIQKAIGWVLREYSKTNPESVRQFIESHPLAALSIREGSKYLK